MSNLASYFILLFLNQYKVQEFRIFNYYKASLFYGYNGVNLLVHVYIYIF